VQDHRGIMFFANNDGVLEYDGTTWRTISTKTRARSLCVDSTGLIYVGLEEDFGTLQADSTGILKYISLKEKIPEEYKDVKQVWDIFTIGNKVVFVAANKLYILQNNRIDVVVSEEMFKAEFVVNNRLYIQKKRGALYCYDNDSLRFLTNNQSLHSNSIEEMLPFENEDILLVTYDQGIFIYNPNKSPSLWKPVGMGAVDDFLIKNKACSGTLLYNGDFAIATNTGGIIVFDKSGKINIHYNKQNGLQSNCSYYLFTDLNGQLWAAHENGISLIVNNLPFANYTDKNGLDGSVYCVQKFKNKLYVGTSNNTYVLNEKGYFEVIKGTAGQNFYLFQANKKLLLGNNQKGLLEINNKKAIQPKSFKQLGASFAILRLHNYPNYVIVQSSNNGLSLLEYKNEQWVFKHFIEGFEKKIRYIVEDNNENFWLTADNQLYKLRLNEALDSVCFSQEFAGDRFHLPESFIMPYRLNNGEIIFGTDKGVYRYVTDENYFEPHPDFPMFKKGVFHLKQNSTDNTIWFEEYGEGTIGEKGALQLINGKYKIFKTPFLKFTDRSCTSAYSINPFSDSLVYFGTTKGLLEYHPKQKANYDIPFNTLIREIDIKDSLIYGGSENINSLVSGDPVRIKYKYNNLIFHYSATFYEESEKNLFSYRLVGSSDTTWSSWTNDHKKEYSNLHGGEYIFEVKSQNIYRKNGVTASFAFEILTPWHQTWWAYMLYAILAIVFVSIIIRINAAQLKRQNKLLQKTVARRTADISKQKEILQTQSDQLKVSNEKLNLLNSTKDKFFAIISHDLRSPFNSILGFTDLLVEDYDSYDDSRRKEIILLLSKASQCAFNLLDNLLTWSRAQRGQIKINKEQLNLKQLVETSIAPYKYNASKKNIEIIINIPADITVFIDRNTAKICVENLVNNAIKFTPEGGSVTIDYHENENNIELSIIDTGVGMTAEAIGKLFRIEEGISTKGTNNEKGTGLGLILCKEFINKNGDDISVFSEVGRGSKFIITHPK